MILVIKDPHSYPKWWHKFVLSFNDSVQFQDECSKMGLKFKQAKGSAFEIHFPDERTFTMMVLKWS